MAPGQVGNVATDAVTAAGESPELVATVLLGLAALAVGGYALRRFRRSRGTQFVALLASHDRVTVLMHPNPDPDAMAAGMGLAALAEQVETDATLVYSGSIQHQENRAFRTVLELEPDCIDDAEDLDEEVPVILVDHDEPRGFTGAEDVRPAAVVDHHPGEGSGEEFTDVRTEYGAASSIVGEYFRDVGARPVAPDQHASEVKREYFVPSVVATGLLYGVLTDTNHLTSGAASPDFEVSSYLQAGVDEALLDRIANPQVSAEVLEAKARAIAGREVRGSFAVSDVGTLSNADAIPQAADELLRLEGVTAVVVCAECDGAVHLSGRSRDDRVHMGDTIDDVLAEFPDANGGGHARMGGGRIPPSASDEPDGVPAHQDRSALIDRLFLALGGEA